VRIIGWERTAVLSKTSYANCCTTLTKRPLRPRVGRFVRVVQQLASEVFERTAVPLGVCSRRAASAFRFWRHDDQAAGASWGCLAATRVQL